MTAMKPEHQLLHSTIQTQLSLSATRETGKRTEKEREERKGKESHLDIVVLLLPLALILHIHASNITAYVAWIVGRHRSH
jgi:hypothetical protein